MGRKQYVNYKLMKHVTMNFELQCRFSDMVDNYENLTKVYLKTTSFDLYPD